MTDLTRLLARHGWLEMSGSIPRPRRSDARMGAGDKRVVRMVRGTGSFRSITEYQACMAALGRAARRES